VIALGSYRLLLLPAAVDDVPEDLPYIVLISIALLDFPRTGAPIVLRFDLSPERNSFDAAFLVTPEIVRTRVPARKKMCYWAVSALLIGGPVLPLRPDPLSRVNWTAIFEDLKVGWLCRPVPFHGGWGRHHALVPLRDP